jgi:pSer/pThr/pTyr-binding forkhead associated (FHA) protein
MDDHEDTFVGSRKGSGGGEEDLPAGLLITLEVVEGPDKGWKYEVRRTRTVLGRKKTDVMLSDSTVSGVHAVLEFVAGKLFITDSDSTNGTTLNGERIETAPCANLDLIGLGDTRLLLSVVEDKYGAFIVDRGADSLTDARLAEEEPTLVTDPLPNPELDRSLHVILDVIAGPDAGKKFVVTHRSTVIGRGEGADFALDDPTLSVRHCQLEIHNKDKMTVKDLASSNGTRLNDHYISAVKIRHADRLQIGATVIKILIHIHR